MLSWCFCLNTKYGKLAVRHGHFILQQDTAPLSCSGVSRNFLIWGEGGIRFNYSHWNFKTCVNVPYVNKTVTDFFWGVYIPIYPPSLRPCASGHCTHDDLLVICIEVGAVWWPRSTQNECTSLAFQVARDDQLAASSLDKKVQDGRSDWCAGRNATERY